MWAAAEGNVEVIKALLELGADAKARSKRGFTPFLFAVREADSGGSSVPGCRRQRQRGAAEAAAHRGGHERA
jgi:hypothetical protein